jgi:hypothetical protein
MQCFFLSMMSGKLYDVTLVNMERRFVEGKCSVLGANRLPNS